jgi:hypothetical protein
MPGLIHFLRCVGRAALKNGGRALAGLLPFGASAYEIVEDACEQYRRDHAVAASLPRKGGGVREGEAPAEAAPPEPPPSTRSCVDVPRGSAGASPSPPGTDPERPYRLCGLLAVGDVSDVHLADARVIKVSRVAEGPALLDNERRALVRLLAAAGDTTYRRYLPALEESFTNAFHQRVNIFAHEPGFFTLEQVHDRHPALDGRHLGWVFNRLLTVLGFCHAHGTLHGAVLPCHVLLHPESHGLRLVGWGQSVAAGRPVHALAARYRDWYPPEVRTKQPAAPATDLFLAARCLIYLAGGDPLADRMPDAVPEPMRRFVRSCLLDGVRMRPGDAWKLQEEFAGLLRRLYGPPKFHRLDMHTTEGDEHG